MTTDGDLQNLSGVLPIVPTVFADNGDLDEVGQRATVDFLLRTGVDGMVVLANASEGYAVTESERRSIIAWVVTQVRGQVPVVVACNHPSTAVASRYAREAEGLGAAAVMMLPPFFGQWGADLDGTRRHFEAVGNDVRTPLILQDHPLAGIALPPSFLAELAHQVDQLHYFKIEAARAPVKIGRVLRLTADRIRGIFGGMAGALVLEEWEQGAIGTMPSSAIPDAFVRVLALLRKGNRAEAASLFYHYLPLINFEIQLGGNRTAKEILMRRGVIRSGFVRGPVRSAWDERTMRAFQRLTDTLRLSASAPS